MAYLRCFYCNTKSATKFTGQSKWDCKSCLATNFLDEVRIGPNPLLETILTICQHGDITDPPVSALKTTPIKHTYLAQHSEYSSSRPSSPGSDSAFCSTCIQNQNLYIKTLAQYDFDTETNRPGYKEDERKYFKFRKELEQRYPQVCEDCQPKALDVMKDANKVAKHDYIRRLMDNSRRTKLKAQMSGITFYGSTVFIGKSLWYAGLFTQLLWHVVALVVALCSNLYPTSDISLPQSITTSLFIMPEDFISINILKDWAYGGLLAGLVSLWWNPKFRDFERGVPKHITGFGNWYSQATILLVVRSFIFYVTGTNTLSDPFATVTMACHGFAVLFITYLATAVHYTLKVCNGFLLPFE
jgi:hypothetical protein